MAPYSAVPPDDPFAVSQAMFTALAAELGGPAAAGLTAAELEDYVDEQGRDVLLQLLQDHYEMRAAREEQQARQHRAPVTALTRSPGPGWRPGTPGCWPPCSAR